MPQVSARAIVPCEPDVAFAVSQTTGALRLRWDAFLREQHFLDGATAPDKGVRTVTRTRLGPSMVSRYVSYRPPTSVGMTMVDGPWFFDTFGGGWRFTPHPDGGTEAAWKYTFTIRPRGLRVLAEPLGRWLLGREIRARIDAFAAACADPEILAAVGER
ncbi:SRPBCC family protein [Brachybacterium sp. AOP43-C2-M15]|uniref:SRPBCC family protein n=1 Tax=Brachybacterium sp. AOP43-C2-M15 TaxID=3457661 RepID=UPI004034342E